MQEKEIQKLKKIIEKNSSTISTNSQKILKNTVSSQNEAKRILVNKKSMKVHYSNCPYIKNTKLENLEEYKELKQALKDGYVRCQCIFNH
jgi:predicted transcriptional regulator